MIRERSHQLYVVLITPKPYFISRLTDLAKSRYKINKQKETASSHHFQEGLTTKKHRIFVVQYDKTRNNVIYSNNVINLNIKTTTNLLSHHFNTYN